MRTLFLSFLSLTMFSCKNDQQTQEQKDNAATTTTVTQNQSVEKIVKPEELPITDTGQTWFRVRITKNDSLWMDYEGSWPVFFLSGNSATLQLSKSKQIMGITDILTIYMNGMPAGKVPVVLSNREKQTASIIMSPVTDGAYGLPISPTEGFLNITKNVNEIVSGNFEAKAVDMNKDTYLFKGYFINTKINPEKI